MNKTIKKVKVSKFNQEREKIILIASIGQCVHIAGCHNFIKIASQLGFKCTFLGPATPISVLIDEIKSSCPEIVGVSYRLTPLTIKPLLEEFKKKYDQLSIKPRRLFFAGTPEVVDIARNFGFFENYFIGGESKYKILSILKEESVKLEKKINIPNDLISRIEWKKPYPIIRSHFGLPNINDTIQGIKQISEAQVLDVISIAPDQNSQEHFFHPEEQYEELSGAGGVPLRTRKDLLRLNEARLTGNHPLLRIYAGTRDFIKLAELYRNTIQNAWAAIPIFWFNQMDGRGPLTLKNSIKLHLEAIKWHAENNIPVEINDSHHWSLRDAPDAIAVADMYLSGIIAKKLGVKHFIAQYMFNTPPSCSLDMDLAKILAKDELLCTLADENFTIIKQVRSGLASFPLDLFKAKGQLAMTTAIQLCLKPDIVHVVNFSEAEHVARPKEIIESCRIVEQVINQMYSSKINFISEEIRERKEILIEQAKWIVNLVPKLTKSNIELENSLTNYKVLNRLVKYGIFDAPHLINNKFARGVIKTKIIDGACYSWDSLAGKKTDEISRIHDILLDLQDKFPKLAKIKILSKNKVMEK